MGSKLEAILNAAKRALGAGEKSFVGNADEQLAKVKVKPATPAKPEAKANPWDETIQLSPEHQRAAAAVEARLTPNGGGNLQPKPVTGPAAAPPQAPAGMKLEQPKPVPPNKPLTPDEKFAQAKAKLEGKPDPYGPVSHNTGSLSLQQPAVAKPNPDSAWARAKAAAEGDHFAAPVAGVRTDHLSLKPAGSPAQAKDEAWARSQAAARSQDQEAVSMTRLTEAQQRDQAWDRARGGDAPAIDMQRLDTSGLGAVTPVGSSAAPRRPTSGGSSGPS